MSHLAPVVAATFAALVLTGCGSGATAAASRRPGNSADRPASSQASARTRHATPLPLSPPVLLGDATGSLPTGFVPAVRWRGETAALIARSQTGIAVLSFDQRLLELRLHSGTVDAGGSGWRWGPAAAGSERKLLVAAFNGGFRLSTGAGGFFSYGQVGARLRNRLGSIVTYADGYTDIGAWNQEVPAPGRQVVSVRQNLKLLIDHGSAEPRVDCLICWGATLGRVTDPARSALGITSDGHLVWAGGEHLTVAQLAQALLGAGVVRAVELDINPEWVAGYLYGRRGRADRLVPVPVVRDQVGVAGFFLVPYSRDFFTVVAK
ncbi:MAG TPA: hypothetical protein VGX45_00480 [Solirubrobacteraceae bacterium]|nr:hypothetical protein [Solirubrobacteraceae bacterium]